MSALDEQFIQQLRATFKVEAEEHLQTMSRLLLELEQSTAGDSGAAIETVYREAHSLKGAARSVDMSDIEALCQTLESVLGDCKRRQHNPAREAFDVFHQVLDLIRGILGTGAALPNDISSRRDQLITRLSGLIPASMETRAAPAAPPPLAATMIAARPIAEPDRPATAETVRISAAKLDSHLLQTEDLLWVKAMMDQRLSELRELHNHFQHWQEEWTKIADDLGTPGGIGASAKHAGLGKADMGSTPALAAFLTWQRDYLRSLDNKLHSITTQTAQDRHGVARRVDDLLEDSKKLVMLPFLTVADVLPRLVRDLCRQQGKEADLVITGGEVEIDKRILEEMKDPLIHILRNGVDHGIEKPEERSRLQKPSRARIEIAVLPVNGSKVEIRISDDGSGVNVDAVKQSAVRQGILSQAEAGALDESTAMGLIFRSEVTTSPMVTSVSGRGLGMAIVRAKAEGLGGHVSIESRRNVGTVLRILLPLTLATFRGILIEVSGQTFAVPSSNVVCVIRVRPEDIHTVENREVVAFRGKSLSLARLDRVLDLPAPPSRPEAPRYIVVAVLSAADQRIGFVISEALHETELLVKALSRPLVRVRNIAGATVLGSGRVVPVLNVSDLVKTARAHGAPGEGIAAGEVAAPKVSKKVLVVEDSITSRMLLKAVLESAGHVVKTAMDGVEAFTMLREEVFDLVVSDVEMPRMNGFDLTSRIRMDKQLSELPVVLVTALESRTERERGIDVGASAYIMKSTFDRSNLLDVVRALA